MSPLLITIIIVCYFSLLIVISLLTGRKTDNDTFFLGNRQSRWYMVAIAMVGASISGVTFVSVPGWAGTTGFTYMQMVMGYLLGYMVIAHVLLPLFYRLQLTSIYSYLEKRFGFYTYKSGALLFLLSKTVGAAARLYLMASVLQLTLFNNLNIPYGVTVSVTIGLILLYTFRGGLKTIIWTDMIQAIVMIAAVILTFIVIIHKMNLSLPSAIELIQSSKYSQMFEFSNWGSSQHFVRQFITGAFMTIVMTGLDQDMMQKNLTCRNLKEAKKNVYWYSFAFIPVNLIFLALGALLYLFAAQNNIALPARADDLFPMIATGGYLPQVVGILFMIGLVAAAYSSADSALAALTTSFSLDILNINRFDPQKSVKIRWAVHIGFSILLGLVIMFFRAINQDTIMSTILTAAGYTYGPLLGLFACGLLTRIHPRDWMVPIIAIVSPLATALLDFNSVKWFGIKLGYEVLLINGALSFLLLLLASIGIKKRFEGI
jgi:Na+/proline symporter